MEGIKDPALPSAVSSLQLNPHLHDFVVHPLLEHETHRDLDPTTAAFAQQNPPRAQLLAQLSPGRHGASERFGGLPVVAQEHRDELQEILLFKKILNKKTNVVVMVVVCWCCFGSSSSSASSSSSPSSSSSRCFQGCFFVVVAVDDVDDDNGKHD